MENKTGQQDIYVPEPKPVRGDFEVGMYYFPGWNTYRAWSALNAFPDRRPLLGYYREGNPEVADWHIKWMLEHGITFIIYDWYWHAGARVLEHGLHDGFFNAKYHDKIKFCVMWANHNGPGSSSAEDMANMTQYWLDNYFLRPDYYKIDGKPVVIFFTPDRMTEDMGVEGTREALERCREMARERGLEGIYFVSCAVPDERQLGEVAQEGYDALTGYNYPLAGAEGRTVYPYADMVKGYKQNWEGIADITSLPYIPITEPGWDARPWHGPDTHVRTDKTPELFKQMLQNAKEFVETRTPNANPKMVLVEAWNEFGEGDHIEPTAGTGFAHLDAIREVFTTASPEHVDIVPRDIGMSLIEVPMPEDVSSWEFNDPQSPGWDDIWGLTNLEVAGGLLTAVTTTTDPWIGTAIKGLDSAEYGGVEIRMRVDKGNEGELFWGGETGGFSASTKFELNPDGQFHTYSIDLTEQPAWQSKVLMVRFDPTDTVGANIGIDYIRFLAR
jgi:hypothetical protein